MVNMIIYDEPSEDSGSYLDSNLEPEKEKVCHATTLNKKVFLILFLLQKRYLLHSLLKKRKKTNVRRMLFKISKILILILVFLSSLKHLKNI